MTTRRERLGRPLRHRNAVIDIVRKAYPKAVAGRRAKSWAIFTCRKKTAIVACGPTPGKAWRAAAKFVNLPRWA